METHLKRLEVLCRVCGRDFSNHNKKDSPKQKGEFKEEIFDIFKVDITQDRPDVFGSLVCRPCVRRFSKYRLQKAKGKPFITYLTMSDRFQEHTKENCGVCERREEITTNIGKKATIVTQPEGHMTRAEKLATQVVNELKHMDSEEKKQFVSILFQKLDSESVTVIARQPDKRQDKRTRATTKGADFQEEMDNLLYMENTELCEMNGDSNLCNANNDISEPFKFNGDETDETNNVGPTDDTYSCNVHLDESGSLNASINYAIKQENTEEEDNFTPDSMEPPKEYVESNDNVEPGPELLQNNGFTDTKEGDITDILPGNINQDNTSLCYISHGDKIITVMPIKLEETP